MIVKLIFYSHSIKLEDRVAYSEVATHEETWKLGCLIACLSVSPPVQVVCMPFVLQTKLVENKLKHFKREEIVFITSDLCHLFFDVILFTKWNCSKTF